ncbi:FlxA-like family protein [Serratia proteamaculans]|uniref:FlxA-like family protein n=1 Tax=Serratia proteamaculans TaxID=28151 RepID=A0A7U0N3W5_SERPR|nr:FlxA-like family protein [Serratia proteamaculans]MBO1504136.1 FlxA-like family protein [Serratia proteamaculans]MDW5513280.1 FlxA-like family protein [Serratia proteamaculans]QQX51968.1 FlxA-like family protein [Serratia proteamaculans]
MSTSITMIVPVKNTVPGISKVFSAPGNEGQLLMAKPVNQQPEGGKMKETRETGGSDQVKVADSSASARIKSLNKQIQDLQQKLVDLKDSDGDPKEIEKQRQLIQAQIKMLQAEIARIQKEEMEKQQAEQMAKTADSVTPAKGDGINRPTALNAVDVYI